MVAMADVVLDLVKEGNGEAHKSLSGSRGRARAG